MIKFRIIVPSYNNEDWVNFNIASILNQTYSNYEVLYINDNSDDRTLSKVLSLVGTNPQFIVINNKENKGAAYNYIEYLDRFTDLSDNDVIIHLDGDDWFIDDDVLTKLNEFYENGDYWMTYGQFVVYRGDDTYDQSYPQGTHYSDFVQKYNLYRRDLWRASHLRTYKWHLFKNIDKQDLKSRYNNEYFWHASDLAWAFPALEMCDDGKIGVVDFYTHVYNNTKQNSIRTAERESSKNRLYEQEIRNKKVYQKNGGGRKLDQINYLNGFMEYNTIPKKFSWCYDQYGDDSDMTLMEDWTAVDYINGRLKVSEHKPIVIRLAEHRSYFKDNLHTLIEKNSHKFDTILTHDKLLLETLPNAVFMPTTECNWWNLLPTKEHPFHKPFKAHPSFPTEELPDDIFQIYQKTKLVSTISSHKVDLPGHITRLEMLNKVKNKLDIFGTCQELLFGHMINTEKKFEVLKDYAFSVAIENISPQIDDYYFSEKISDCFITGTIPIYRGCKNIGKFFDIRGIIQFETVEELEDILNNLSMDLYYSMMDSIKINYELALKTPLTQDLAYEYYYKPIIEKNKNKLI